MHKRLIKNNTEDNIIALYVKNIINNISNLSCTIQRFDNLDTCANRDDIYKILYELQKIPIEIIKNALYEYIKDDETLLKTARKIFYNINNNYKYNFCFFISIFTNKLKLLKLIKKTPSISDIENALKIYKTNHFSNDTTFGIINSSYHSILKYIYSKLNLQITYIEYNLQIKKWYTIKSEYNDYLISTPTEDFIDFTSLPTNPINNRINNTDILILTTLNESEFTNYSKIELDIDLDFFDDKSKIHVNGEIYILDYVLLISNKKINDAIGEHVISGIKINNEKYIYDGDTFIKNFQIQSPEPFIYKQDCGFTKYDWKNFNEGSDLILYNYLCESIETNYNDVFRIKYLPHGDRMYYNNDYTKYIYIKESLYSSRMEIN